MIKQTEFEIKVPVFITDETSVGDAFNLTYDDLIDGIITRIDNYNSTRQFILEYRRNKSSQRQIETISYEKVSMGDRPAILINVNSYLLNKSWKLIKNDIEVPIEKSDKIGDDQNYFLLCPNFRNKNPKAYYWIVLVYDEPNRESDEIIPLTKSVMKNIFKQNVTNIKLPNLVREIENQLVNIKLILNSVEFSENSLNDKLKIYQAQSKSTTKTEYDFNGVPASYAIELINDKINTTIYKKITKIIRGHKEYKINQEIKKFKTGNNLLVEQHFNFAEKIAINDTERLYEQTFMLKIMDKVLTKYLTNDD